MQGPQSPHKARKRFGQNFLVDQTIINHIVRSIGPKADQNLVEIGPGQGAITRLLLSANPGLQIIEIDRDLVPRLQNQFGDQYPKMCIHEADALRFDFSQLGSAAAPLRVVGNLPYNISTPLIFHLLSYVDLIQDMHFMLQKEVVTRMAASPGEKNYGRLSVMTQYHCAVDSLFDVGPECFQPAPKVDSAIIRLTPYTHKPFTAARPKTLDSLVRTAFSQRRKTIRNALKTIVSQEQFDQLDVDANLRPENLSVETYVRIANFLNEVLSDGKSPQ